MCKSVFDVRALIFGIKHIMMLHLKNSLKLVCKWLPFKKRNVSIPYSCYTLNVYTL